jgi:hypothetical protein
VTATILIDKSRLMLDFTPERQFKKKGGKHRIESWKRSLFMRGWGIDCGRRQVEGEEAGT